MIFKLIQNTKVLLEKSSYASIINIGSIYGIYGPDLSIYENTKMNNPAAYSVSKAGLLQLTRWMSTVLAPKIRVNSISPGGIFRNQPEEFVNRYIQKTPLKRRVCHLVRPGGFEPPTFWSVARHSIQLSYGRIKNIIQYNLILKY